MGKSNDCDFSFIRSSFGISFFFFISARMFSFENMLPWESYWISSHLPHCWVQPLTPLWLAVEWMQFLKKDQLTMRFVIIAVSRSFIWIHLILSQPKKTKNNSTTKKRFFFSNLRPHLGLQGVFVTPYGGVTSNYIQDFSLQPQSFWMSQHCTLLFISIQKGKSEMAIFTQIVSIYCLWEPVYFKYQNCLLNEMSVRNDSLWILHLSLHRSSFSCCCETVLWFLNSKNIPLS